MLAASPGLAIDHGADDGAQLICLKDRSLKKVVYRLPEYAEMPVFLIW
jgi:hypothetical protein